MSAHNKGLSEMAFSSLSDNIPKGFITLKILQSQTQSTVITVSQKMQFEQLYEKVKQDIGAGEDFKLCAFAKGPSNPEARSIELPQKGAEYSDYTLEQFDIKHGALIMLAYDLYGGVYASSVDWTSKPCCLGMEDESNSMNATMSCGHVYSSYKHILTLIETY